MVKAYGFIGASNCGGVADWRTVVSPPSAGSLARLKYWMVDVMQFADNVGSIVALDFNASRMDAPSTSYDYPMTGGAPAQLFSWSFGPEVFAGLALADFLATDVQIVKLGPGGAVLRDIGALVDRSGNASWFWTGSHRSFDPTLPRSSTPYLANTRETGTASASGLTSLTDGSKSWTTNQHAFRWVRMSGALGYVLSNTPTVLTVGFWVPNPFGPAPTPAAYTIEDRACIPASCAKSFLEGYCVAAQTAAGGIGLWDLDGLFILLGEITSTLPEHLALFKSDLLRLIWYVRNNAVSLGLTSLTADKLKIVIPKIPTGPWPNAGTINRIIEEIAHNDPFIRTVDVLDVSLGGFDGVTDPIHYNAAGQVTLGKKLGAAMIAMSGIGSPPRRSVNYPGQHAVLKPLWSIGNPVWRRAASFAELSAVDAAQRRYPVAYLLKEALSNTVPVWLGRDGRTLSNSGDGTLLGYAFGTPGPGLVAIQELILRSQGSPLAINGAFNLGQVRGWCYPCGSGDPAAFSESSKVSGFHTLQVSSALGGLPTRWRTTIPATSIDREWLLRGHRGNFGVAAQLTIDERPIAGTLWMRHILGFGDYRQPQALGVGALTLAPTVEVGIEGVAIEGQVIPVDASPDDASPVPSGMAIAQLNHGAGTGLVESVIWPNCRIKQTLEIDWRGIVGCHRLVFSFTLPFDVPSTDDLTLELPVWAQNTFDKQFVYDPATSTETDLSWDPTNNRFHEIAAGIRATYNKTGTLFSSGASWFTKNSGVFGWQGVGGFGAPADGLVWAIYSKVGGSAMRLPGLLRLGNWTEPLVSADGGFASYDQRNYSYAKTTFASAGIAWAANTTFRVAQFLLVGTMAQVKAAADQLYALGVNATWTG